MDEEQEVGVNEFQATYDHMVQYFKELGFEHLCYRAKSSGTHQFTETWSSLDGMFVELDPARNRFQLIVIDGMIECKIRDLGFPNRHTPVFIEKLKRHLPRD